MVSVLMLFIYFAVGALALTALEWVINKVIKIVRGWM